MKEEGRTAWRHPRLSLLTNYIPIHYTTQGQPDNLFGESDYLTNTFVPSDYKSKGTKAPSLTGREGVGLLPYMDYCT